jgi:intein/homing endonuclease
MKLKPYYDKMRRLYPKIGAKAFSEKFNLKYRNVVALALYLNLKVDKNVHYKLRDEHEYLVNHSNFEKIKHPLHAYLLGLLWADGHISKNKNEIILSSTYPDANEFIPLFEKTGKWSVYKKKHNRINWKESVSIQTTNFYLKEVLVNYGFLNRENGFESIANLVPAELHYMFLRGLSDGDGCFTKNKKNQFKFSLCSCFLQNWDWVSNILNGLKINHKIERTRSKSGSYSKIHIWGQLRVKAWGRYLYSDFEENNIGLTRKFLIFKELNERKLRIIKASQAEFQ